MTTLNATFESKLALEDEDYKCSSENFNIPTPLQRTSKIHHISSIQNTSFDPVPVTPHSTRESCLRPVCRRLTYSSSDDDDTTEDEVSLPYSAPQVWYHAPDPQALSSKHTLHTSIHLEEEEDEEEDSTLFHWRMNIGLLKKFLTDHYVYTNIHYHMDYAPTHVHIQITKPPLISKPWI